VRSLVLSTLAGVALTAAATPAAAAEPGQFRLMAGSVVAHGKYERMMSIPEQPVPPFRITGTLTGRSLFRCAVVQVGGSGPADGLEWRTVARHCGPGRTPFRAEASYLFRGVQPPVRLCAGWATKQAEGGRQCDQYRPPADR